MNNKNNEWRLPTKDELNKMYVNFHSYGVGNFDNDYYWTLTTNSNNAWAQYFHNGYQDDKDKTFTFLIRAVRTFETKYVNNYEIGQELDDGFIFDIRDNEVSVCKKQDEDDVYTWYEAMELFENKQEENKMINDENWRLPTKEELSKMCVNLHKEGVGNFASDRYWSSDYDNTFVWYRDFNFDSQSYCRKEYSSRVRLVKTFESSLLSFFEIGGELPEGFIFDIIENTVFICKKEDEGTYTWHEAIGLFESKEEEGTNFPNNTNLGISSNIIINPQVKVDTNFTIVVNNKSITLNKQEAESLRDILIGLLK